MKNKIILLALVSFFLMNKSFGQLMTMGFIKNCMSYARTTVTDELKKKQIFMIDRKAPTPNKLLQDAVYYSNDKGGDSIKGEIRVLSSIIGSKQITEITYITGLDNDYSKNYNDVYNQMVSFFHTEKPFKSGKYKTDVLKFTNDKSYYYVYKNGSRPVIVISNYKIDDEYFAILPK
ncbi:MAG: hypothetical protein JWP12_912 [Bacteroidetes bacterium]|nr:hypothetical protein [Bacteroidota bacterium]